MKRSRRFGVIVLAAAFAVVPGLALADDGGVGTLGGPGGDSNACSDGWVPGQGLESGDVGPAGFQGGSDPGRNHTAYADVCFRVDGPTINIPIIGSFGTRYGVYTSERIHGGNECAPSRTQFILTEDSDSSIKPLPDQNTCP